MHTRGLCSSFTLALTGVALLGCGGAPRDTRFPTREEISALAAVPPPAQIKVGDGLDTPTWQLAGPLPEASSDELASATPWGQAARAATATRPGAVASQGMECAAREAATFLLAHDNRLPGRAIRRFIAGRCGVQTSYLNLGSSWLTGVAAGKSDLEVYGAFREKVDAMLGGVPAGPRFIGLSFVRSGDKAALVLASAKRHARLDAFPLVQGAAAVVLRGDLLTPAERIRALVSAGSFGFQECTQNLAIDLPRFEISCPLTRGDSAATVEIAAFAPNRMLGESVVDLTVFSGPPSTDYTGSTAAEGSAPVSKEALLQSLAARINAVRKDAGMQPLRVSAAQSKTADVLAPYYFAAVTGATRAELADKIALGMLAGWDVEGEVREGHFSSGAYPHLDASRLLDELAARPFGRETLFDRSAGAVAFGIVPSAEGALGAVIGTYSAFDAADTPTEETNQVMQRLTALRKAKGLPPPTTIIELDQDARRAAARVKGGDETQSALDDMLHASVARLQTGSVQGWALSASTIKDLKFPSELLSLPTLRLAISTVHYKAPGSPWTQILAFVVILHLDGPSTARGGAPHHG